MFLFEELPLLLFVAVAFPPVAEFVEFSVGDSALTLEFELVLLLCEVEFELLLLDEPLVETFWFDVFCVEFSEVFCDWFWELVCDWFWLWLFVVGAGVGLSMHFVPFHV